MSVQPNYFGDLPKILSSDFSIVLMEGTILKSEKNKIKEFLNKFSYRSEAFAVLFEELKGMTPMVRYASMKNLVALFDRDDGRYGVVKTRGHVALKLIAEMAVRPSEVQDGLDLIKKIPSIFRRIQSSYKSGGIPEELVLPDFGLEEFLLPLTTLIKKLEVFEICEARLTLQKIKVVKSLSETMLLLKGDGEIWEKITECMESICNGVIELQGILEQASGTDLVALLSKTEEEYRSRLADEVEPLVVKGRLVMNKEVFDFKWTHRPASRYHSTKPVDLKGDAICYVELLVHYLNLKMIRVAMNFVKLETDLFGEDETGESWVMLKVALQNQDAHLVVNGLVQIRSNSESLCDLAQKPPLTSRMSLAATILRLPRKKLHKPDNKRIHISFLRRLPSRKTNLSGADGDETRETKIGDAKSQERVEKEVEGLMYQLSWAAFMLAHVPLLLRSLVALTMLAEAEAKS